MKSSFTWFQQLRNPHIFLLWNTVAFFLKHQIFVVKYEKKKCCKLSLDYSDSFDIHVFVSYLFLDHWFCIVLAFVSTTSLCINKIVRKAQDFAIYTHTHMQIVAYCVCIHIYYASISIRLLVGGQRGFELINLVLVCHS